MAFNDPFVRGENSKLRCFQELNGAIKPIIVPIKNWKVGENATETNEGVQGENRDRLDKVTNYYDITFDVYVNDATFLDSYVLAQEALDSNGTPLKQLFSVQYDIAGGGRVAFSLQEAVVGPIDLGNTSRQDPLMISVKARCRYFKKIPTFV